MFSNYLPVFAYFYRFGSAGYLPKKGMILYHVFTTRHHFYHTFTTFSSAFLWCYVVLAGTHKNNGKPSVYKVFRHFTSPERAGIRTPDNLIKSQVLYHLSYTPIFNFNWFTFQLPKTGLAGFEPANAGVKVLCLTAWR